MRHMTCDQMVFALVNEAIRLRAYLFLSSLSASVRTTEQ